MEMKRTIRQYISEDLEKSNKKNKFISNECIDILNFRIEQEEQSSRLYESMSLWLNDNGYMNASKVWENDSQGELVHAGWAKTFLLDMGVQPKLPSLKEPPQTFNGLPDIIRKSFDHEIKVTEQCNELGTFALKTGNHLLYQLAIKFMTEQQEELGKLQTLLDKLKAFGEDKIAIRLLENEMA